MKRTVDERDIKYYFATERKKGKVESDGKKRIAKEENAQVPGLLLMKDFISVEEEKALLRAVYQNAWNTELKRRRQFWGYKYNYKVDKNDYLGPLPDWTAVVTGKLAAKGFEGFDQMLVNEYNPGQGIAAHTDITTMFGPCVVSLSLQSDAEMCFSLGSKVVPVFLKRRSIVILQGEARYKWKHEIKARKTDPVPGTGKKSERGVRVSLTLRTVTI
jgi:alkylated DNA repair dioxygenase AlkB